MKRIPYLYLHLCLFLTPNVECFAAAAEEKPVGQRSFMARVCSFVSRPNPIEQDRPVPGAASARIEPTQASARIEPIQATVRTTDASARGASGRPSSTRTFLHFTEDLIYPKTLENAVESWRLCYALRLGFIIHSEKAPPLSEFYNREQRAEEFIRGQISKGLSDEDQDWLRDKIIVFGKDSGRAIFPGLFHNEGLSS